MVCPSSFNRSLHYITTYHHLVVVVVTGYIDELLKSDDYKLHYDPVQNAIKSSLRRDNEVDPCGPSDGLVIIVHGAPHTMWSVVGCKIGKAINTQVSQHLSLVTGQWTLLSAQYSH
jgi:hypothetical protein